MTKIKDIFNGSLALAVLVILIGGMLIIGAPTARAKKDSEGPYGAQHLTEEKDAYTLQEMLTYAIEDEYKARAEYELIIEKMDGGRPFTNIVKSEETHIALLKPLFEAHNIQLPEDSAGEHVFLPYTIDEALKIGVQAEIDNIAMYEKFLSQDLPEDVESAFERLKNASQNHLKAFKRGDSEKDRWGGSRGRGSGSRRVDNRQGRGPGPRGEN